MACVAVMLAGRLHSGQIIGINALNSSSRNDLPILFDGCLIIVVDNLVFHRQLQRRKASVIGSHVPLNVGHSICRLS